MKRNLLLLIVSLLLAIFLTACGSGSEEAASDQNNEDNKDTEEVGGNEETVAGDVELDFWFIDPGVKQEIYMEAVARFEEKNPNVKVNALQIPNDDYKQRMVVSMSGGNPPDVFHSWGGGWLKEFVESDQVLDLTNEDIDFDQYYDVALANSTYDDKVFGLPLGLSPFFFYYNKEIFADNGLEVPETYDDLLNAIDVLKANNVIPIALANQTKWPGAFYLMYLADRIGGSEVFESAYHRTGGGFDHEAYVQAGEYIQELVERGAFNPGFNGVPYDAGQGRQLIYSGQAAMMLMTTGFLNNMRDEFPEFEERMGVFTFPGVTGGKGDPKMLNAGAAPVWSATKSEHSKYAVELIKELTSAETAQAYVDRSGAPVAIVGVESQDPFVREAQQMIEEASSIVFPYDQTLPPVLGELHKDTVQELFGLTMTPEDAAKAMEEKAKEILD
ncbi:extracellular solute-binding protein [Halalkalibacter akibai]|uniref:N-acetyl-D-glucosamine ABC transport system n=1 Tax=Halalkalibacter akibai (strain ATCC 43226 / DSM 21942 / CIP 109018 / JCM 9157 / 1139) TaxID=1236973 RepID=W4QU60_HALA3|nr:extracellular solute-binding protein [Halalkalibacter akibai]GAE34869.1 N-acetyl-D-glucosamine ABC transport system [Halalkalibacter akibai JCM 9157]